jgi:hypothetical protein
MKIFVSLVLTLGGVIGWVSGALAQVAEPAPAVNDVVAGEPGGLGITAKMRPILPTLAAGDPLRIALHFEKKDGPIDHSDAELAAQMLDKSATLQSFEIAVKAPGGKWQLLKPDEGKLEPRPSMLYSDGTFLLELTADKLRTLNAAGHEELALPWEWKHQVQPGVYQFAVRGTLKLSTQARTIQERGKPPVALPATTTDIAFKVGPSSIRVERADMKNQSLAELEKAAIAALKEHEAVKAEKLSVGGIDGLAIADAGGNRVIRVRANIPEEASEVGADGGIILRPMIAGGTGYWQYEVTMNPAGKPVSFARARKGFCIARGTHVATPEGRVLVEDLRVGQQVWSYDVDTNSLVPATVLGVFASRSEESLQINNRLRLTAEHPVLAKRDGKTAWRNAGTLRKGDVLIDSRLQPVRITSLKTIGGEVEVFDVAVDGPHNFFAGDLLVHNKSIAWTPQHFVPWYSLWNRAPAM